MTGTDARPSHARSRATGTARAAAGVMVVLLLVQYVLGLVYNLYGPAPTEAHPLQMFTGRLLAAHSALGILLVLGAIYTLIAAGRTRTVLPIVASAVGIAAIVGAFAGGTAFLRAGADADSLTMGLLLALALLCYAAVIFTLPRRVGSGSAPS